MTREMLKEKLTGAGKDFPFLGLAILAGLVALAFLTIMLVDAYKQWKLREPLRKAARKRAEALRARTGAK